jgi:hypothetical protein
MRFRLDEFYPNLELKAGRLCPLLANQKYDLGCSIMQVRQLQAALAALRCQEANKKPSLRAFC